jgi:iron complex outermembrane receptor protein
MAQSAPPALPEVWVSATRFTDDAATLPFGVQVLNQDDIARSGAATVNEALIKLLGVQGRSDLYGGGNATLDLRGFGATADSNQVVIVDGVRLNEADLGGTRLAGIPIHTVERIEVLRGSGAVLYGNGATGGVIVITTQAGKGVARKTGGEIYAAAGSHQLAEARAQATLAVGGFSMDVAGSTRQSDNHRANFASSSDANSLQAQWSNDWLRLGASHAYDVLDSGLPGALTQAQYQANPWQTLTPQDHGHIATTRDALFVNADVGAWQLTLDGGQRHKQLDSVNSGFAYGYAVQADTLALRARQDLRWGSLAHQLTLGYDLGHWARQVPGAFGSDSNQDNHALYAQSQWTLPAGTRVLLGYRSEHFGQTDSASTLRTESSPSAWELGLTQSLSAAWTVFGRMGSSYRLPNFDELGFTQAGVALHTQTSRDAELGSRWSVGDSRVELRYYHSDLRNELGYDPSVANPMPWDPTATGANVNFDPTRRAGLELQARHALSKTLALSANLALRQATFEQGAHQGKTVPLVADKTLALGADWQVLPGHSVHAGATLVGSQFVDYDNTCKIPGYASADLRWATQWGRAELALGVNNLLDKRYYTQAYTPCAAGLSNAVYPEPGRSVTAAARVRF